MTPARIVFGTLLLSAFAALAAGCGGGNGSESGAAIEVRAEDYKFVPSELSIPAGQTLTLRLKNVTKQAHDLEVQGMQVQMMGEHQAAQDHAGTMPGTLALHTEKGKTVSATFMAEKAGTYDFWCTISGHKELGMVGKLIVTSGATGVSFEAPATSTPPLATPPASAATPPPTPSTTVPATVPTISFGDGGHEGH